MVRAEGLQSLWRGLTLTLWRDVPFSGVYWFGYETVKGALKAQRERQVAALRPFQHSNRQVKKVDEGTFTDAFIAGAVSGSVAAFLTTPFDVGKTRIQVVNTPPPPAVEGLTAVRSGFGGGQAVYKSMPNFLAGIYREEGIKGLWRGCVPRMLKVSPACAIMVS